MFCVIFLSTVIFVYPAFAEIKVFEKEVEAIVGEGQSQSQVESYALQRAKRLAVEEAGTYLSSLSVVQNYQLQKDEVIALASGIVRTVPVGLASVREANGVYYVKIKAKIEVDTSVLDRQIQDIMKEKGTLKELENERKKNKELEEKLANLKSSDVKRLEEMNAQAIALERERDKQRLLREEQALKAKGELSRAEAEHFAKEREMQEKISRTLAEQEKTKREEAVALAAEQDRVKRAQLENEQRWNDLARKTKLNQESWVPIDDSLSLKQAVSEVNDLKREIGNLKKRLDYQYNENTKNMKAAYAQQRALSTAKMPPAPTPKDAFETTAEYNKRVADYERTIKTVGKVNEAVIEKLKAEENLMLSRATTDYFKQKIDILAPFVKRLEALQARSFLLPTATTITVTLEEPEADKNRFPLQFQYGNQKWTAYWTYKDRNQARDLYKTRTFLKAEGLFQLSEGTEERYILTSIRLTHSGMDEKRDFPLVKPKIFDDINDFNRNKMESRMEKDKQITAAFMYEARESGDTYKEPVTGMEFVLIKKGCFKMGDTFGVGAVDEMPVHDVCVGDFMMSKYEVTVGQFKSFIKDTNYITSASTFGGCYIVENNKFVIKSNANWNNPGYNQLDKYPVACVSWKDANEFANWFSKKNGKKLRLPTEAEWEYAARSGGKNEKYSGSNSETNLSEYSVYIGSGFYSPDKVGSKEPNGIGLYDMTGNVWEWVQDWYEKDYYAKSPKDNPKGPSRASAGITFVVHRGGSWTCDAKDLRTSKRKQGFNYHSYSDVGFRLIRSAEVRERIEAEHQDASEAAELNSIENDGRFYKYANGTVLDIKTKLMWATKDNGSYINWANAKAYCENYRSGGYTDWRMPTQDELAGLYDGSIERGDNYHLTNQITLTGGVTWGAETRGWESAYFYFVTGKPGTAPPSDSRREYRALPVRSAK